MRETIDRLVLESPSSTAEPIAAPADPEQLAAEIRALPRTSELARSGPLVVRATADPRPW